MKKTKFCLLIVCNLVILSITSCTHSKSRGIKQMVGLTTNIRPTLVITEVAPLQLEEATNDRKLKHIAASSGIQIINDDLYTLSDDELFLTKYNLNSFTKGTTIPILLGSLPSDNTLRKKQKPDWEALTFLPPNLIKPSGALLLIPSGSTPSRYKAGIFPLNNSGEKIIDFSRLYGEFLKNIKELNIEAVTVNDKYIKFFNRGNGTLKENAIINVNLNLFIQYLLDPTSKKFNISELISSTKFYNSNLINKSAPMATFSDAVALKNGEILFVAAVENTISTYDDGEVLGSYIGLLDINDNIKWMSPLSINIKAEGIAVKESDSNIEIFITNDPDDPQIPSSVFKLMLAIDYLK